MTAESLIRRANKLFASDERSNAEFIWTLLSEYIIPNQHGLFAGQEAKGAKRTKRLYDSTAIQANHDLASAMHSVLTNPATKWAKLKFSEDALNEDKEASMWLENANNKLHDAFAESNFTNEIAKGYKLFSGLGSMSLLHEERQLDDNAQFTGFNFKLFHQAEVAWSENIFGRVDTVYRKFKMTGRQILSRWGKKSPEVVIKKSENNPEAEYILYHLVFPREDKDIKINEVGRAAPKNRPYASVYVAKDGPKILEEGGYYEFPIHVTRWETMPGEVYGRGPGHIAIPDVRTLNKAKELGLHAIAKSINPPILAEQRSVLSSLDLRPGQVSIVKDIQGIREMVTQNRFDVTQFAVEDLRNAIKNIFFIDKFQLPPRTETGEMTAFEIAQRTEQMQRVLGPTLGRLNHELLDPLVRRGFNMMLRGGAFGEIPLSLQESGGSIEVEYVNALARSQKIEEVTSMQALLQDVGLLAQLDPSVIDTLDFDAIVALDAKRRGVPEAILRDPREVQQIREQRAEQQQQMAALEAGVQAADIASKMSNSGGGQGVQ